MNTKNLKAYAPKARTQFIEAIAKRAAQFGIYEDKISDIQFEGGTALIEGRAFTKKQGEQRKRLEKKIQEKPLATHKERYNLFIREMAYTWFNRLAAIRYMELHDYFDHGFRVLSHPNSQEQLPEILDNASDVADTLNLDKSHIIELQLAGDKEEELYRELLLGQCHYLCKVMPFMFEALDDATELLLPDNLTKTDSILKGLVNEIPEEDWSEIEVIGWLYQFYISEHKDAVIGKVVKSEDIPAATQLFTPNWIVKYLVQNSLGRQWLATYPESELKGKMEYYIEPAEQSDDVIEQLKAITPTSIDPEQIKVLDPAAGSGHILVEVYEVLREIYLERGYRLREIPELILTKNIYGLDIDDRAAQLAGFALMMKAREDDRRIFQRVERGDVHLNVYSLQSTEGLDIDKLWQALNLEGKQTIGSTGGLFDDIADESENRHPELDSGSNNSNDVSGTNTSSVIPCTSPVIPAKAGIHQEHSHPENNSRHPELDSGSIYQEYYQLLQILKEAFLQAKTLGSLIQVDKVHLKNLVALKELLQSKEKGSDPSAKQAATDLLSIVNQAVLLARKYDVVVANPPYMGVRSLNKDLKSFLSENFQYAKHELYSVFLQRSLLFLKNFGDVSFITRQGIMFDFLFKELRGKILGDYKINTWLHLGAGTFPELGGEVTKACAFNITNLSCNKNIPTFLNLSAGSSFEKKGALNKLENIFTNYSQKQLGTSENAALTYWASEKVMELSQKGKQISSYGRACQGLSTGDNDKFLRYWFEVDYRKIEFDREQDNKLNWKKWYPHSKGGTYRRWYGNNDIIIDWEDDGKNIKSHKGAALRNTSYYFKEGITWTDISGELFGARYVPSGATFNTAGPTFIPNEEQIIDGMLAYMNSQIFQSFINLTLHGLHFNNGEIGRIVFDHKYISNKVIELEKDAISISKMDWDSQEISKDFKRNEMLLFNEYRSLDRVFQQFEKKWHIQTQTLKSIEDHLNLDICNSLKLDEEFCRSVDEASVSLVNNPKYRLKNKKEHKFQLTIRKSDTFSEFVSYSLGCMMGRYSLDREGLVYAHSGNKGFKELVAEGAYQTFPADDDGIVPLASEDWLFEDDATARFREFVKTVWDAEHLQENLEFVAESLCLHAIKHKKSESAMDTIRRYFSTKFFKDHCQTYKKRPIYWLFSSGKEKAFECLVYLHRYNESTLARMRTEYVTPLMGKYEQQQSLLTEQIVEASTTEKRRIEKELKSLEKKQAELRTFDEQLKHYAEKRITLDLDDGVKVNYGKFGNLLADVKAIHGKAVK